MSNTLEILENIIKNRIGESPDLSYVSSLNSKGVDTILKKIGEESAEVIISAKDNDKDKIIYESCDLLFHLMVLLSNKGIKLDDLYLEIERRMNLSGIAEKESRSQNK